MTLTGVPHNFALRCALRRTHPKVQLDKLRKMRCCCRYQKPDDGMASGRRRDDNGGLPGVGIASVASRDNGSGGMTVPAPHFLLFSESSRYAPRGERTRPQWRFVLEAVDGTLKLEATDEEPDLKGDRLDLLAVVRGLEALDQPSRVTLVTPSQYVSRGLRFGLEEWRETGWQWERFGQMTPVKNRDLWQRIDQALKFHNVEVRNWRYDEREGTAAATQHQTTSSVKMGWRGMAKMLTNVAAWAARSARKWSSGLAQAWRRRTSVDSRSALA